MVLNGLKGTVVNKLEKMGDIIYEYGADIFKVIERKRVERLQSVRSRRQKEIEKLVKERRQLRKQWRKATVDEREGINVLQEELRGRLVVLRRTEQLRRK